MLPAEIVIYGAGKTGRKVCAAALKAGIKTLCFLDQCKTGEWNGIRILNGKEISEKDRTKPVILALHDGVHAASGLLHQLAFQDVRTLASFNLDLKENGKEIISIGPLDDIDFIHKNRSSYESAREIFADEISKNIFSDLKQYLLTGTLEYLRPKDSGPMYYSDNRPFVLKNGMNFVDWGAFTGDTIEILTKQIKFSTIYAFEPDPLVFEELQKYLASKKDLPETIAFQTGVAETNGIQSFSSAQDGGACFADGGGTLVAATALDKLFVNKRIDMIKMDIEGAEQSALLGAKRIIRECSPLLAISVYHKITDFWEIPLLIKSMNASYHFYLRSHNDCFHDTVCYAVPERFMK